MYINVKYKKKIFLLTNLENIVHTKFITNFHMCSENVTCNK